MPEPPFQSLHESENGEDASTCMLPQESASLHGMLHASRQWLGEISQSSAMSSRAFPQTPFSETYIGNANPDEMQDYESEEADYQMDEDISFGSGMHDSEEEWVRYTSDLEKSVSSLPQVVIETCKQTETHVCLSLFAGFDNHLG